MNLENLLTLLAVWNGGQPEPVTEFTMQINSFAKLFVQETNATALLVNTSLSKQDKSPKLAWMVSLLYKALWISSPPILMWCQYYEPREYEF